MTAHDAFVPVGQHNFQSIFQSWARDNVLTSRQRDNATTQQRNNATSRCATTRQLLIHIKTSMTR